MTVKALGLAGWPALLTRADTPCPRTDGIGSLGLFTKGMVDVKVAIEHMAAPEAKPIVPAQ